MGRKKKKETVEKEIVEARVEGKKIMEISAEQGLAPSTIHKVLKENMTEAEVEKFQKLKKAKYAALLKQQMEIQERPDVAEHNALRFGAGNIVNLEKAAALAEGRLFEGEQFQAIQVNINNLYLEYEKLEQQKREILGEEYKGGPNAIMEGAGYDTKESKSGGIHSSS